MLAPGAAVSGLSSRAAEAETDTLVGAGREPPSGSSLTPKFASMGDACVPKSSNVSVSVAGRMSYRFGSIDELGDGYGFRKVRRALGVTAFGVNIIVMPPRYEGFLHYHDRQDELYFVHRGTARVDVGGEERVLGPGGLFHAESTTPRRVSNAGDDDLVLLVVGGKDGYVERDGHLVDPDRDLARRASFGRERDR
jgi:mannose-6-phosphate isomerase-like protein (cupin superfamily)